MMIEVNGIKLFYEIKGSGKNLLLVHGNGEDHHIFDVLVNVLKKDFTCYCLDSRGHGKSSKVEEYSYQVMAEDIKSFIRVLNLKNVAYYGFSDGGIIGLLVASQSDLISELMISGANLNPRGLKRYSYWSMMLSYVLKRDPGVKLMLKQPNISNQDLHEIKARTLVLAGSNDVVKKKHTKDIAKNINDSKLLILSNEDHSSYIVDSTKLAPIMRQFLKL